MIRKIFLKWKLTRVAGFLIKRYGKNKYYTGGQIDTTMKKHRLMKFFYKDIKLLFLNETDYRTQTGQDNYKSQKTSLYLYLKKDINDKDIEKNDYIKLLDIDDSTSNHTPIGPNSNLSAR